MWPVRVGLGEDASRLSLTARAIQPLCKCELECSVRPFRCHLLCDHSIQVFEGRLLLGQLQELFEGQAGCTITMSGLRGRSPALDRTTCSPGAERAGHPAGCLTMTVSDSLVGS